MLIGSGAASARRDERRGDRGASAGGNRVPRRRARAALPLLLSVALLGGCAAWFPRPAATVPDVGAVPMTMIDDLVAALVQVHEPRVTTLQVSLEPASALERALIERLAVAGYGIQRVDADQGAYRVALERRDVTVADRTTDEATPVTLALSVGSLEIHRRYARGDDGVRAAGALHVGGTRRAITLDDAARFGDAADETHARVVYTGASAVPADTPLISLITDEVVREVAREASGVRGSRSPSIAAVNSGRLEVSNLFYAERGAFGALRESFETSERLTVIFPNDSMRLGPEGKRQLARLVTRYREESDMIGLIGCSNGPTALAIGNEGLALGRSKRVADELLALGVTRERILDEGCWSPVAARDRFPSRGVVVELLRRSS